jgi:hypothetical protein
MQYDAVYSCMSLSKFRRNILSPSSGSKNKPDKRLEERVGDYLFRLLFRPENVGSTSLRNVGKVLPYYTASNPGRQ